MKTRLIVGVAIVAFPSTAFAFDGRAVYVGGGMGIVDNGAPSWRAAVVFPVASDYTAIEAGGVYSYFRAMDHHGDEVSSLEASIMAGFRFGAAPDAVLRPFIAPRVMHVHFFSDPWGDHSDDHASHHRWAAGAGAGFDIGLGGADSRWRFGLDAEAYAVTGPGVDLLVHTTAMLGIGF